MSDVYGSKNDTGWIPYSERTREGQRMTNEFHERIQTFGDVGSTVDVPERLIWAEEEMKHLGYLLPRCYQRSGCCVGAGSWVAILKSMLGDALFRNDPDALHPHFPWAPYGKGRELGGMRRTGEGSFGAPQSEAVQDDVLGLLPYDDPRFPQPTIFDGNWWKWTAREEIAWSHPSNWPVSEQELASEGKPFGMQDVTRVKDSEQGMQLTAQGYGITVASMFGTRNPRVREGVLFAEWNDRWAHQESIGGYWQHPKLGLIWIDDNQWSKNAHPICPTLNEFGSNGSYWYSESNFDKRCRDGEVYAHASGGFPARPGLWETQGWF